VEKALAVLPAAAAIPAGQAFFLPQAGDLQRSGAVAKLMEAAGVRSDCYWEAAFHQQWAERATGEAGVKAAASGTGSDSE
jgi:hypothetical protein